MLAQASEFQTPLHQWSIGVKFLIMMSAMMIIFFVAPLWGQLLISAGLFLIYLGLGRSFLSLGLYALRPLIYFVAFLLIWKIAQAEAEEGFRLSFRLVNAFACANLFTMTTRLDDMLSLFTRALAPLSVLGLKPRTIALTLALTLRFIPVLRQKSDHLKQSWRARSDKRLNWRIVTPLTFLALDDASQIADALRARGGASTLEENDDERT